MIDASNIGFGELEEEDDASMNGSRQAIAKIGLEDLEKQFVSKAKVESSIFPSAVKLAIALEEKLVAPQTTKMQWL